MNIRSHQRLSHAHPALRKLFIEAAKKCPVDIEISETARTKKRQEELVKAGASMTMNSRHIPSVPKHEWYGKIPVSHAVDFYCTVGGKVRWDWHLYKIAADHIMSVAKELKIQVVWGGSWKTFKDGPHIELNHKIYP